MKNFFKAISLLLAGSACTMTANAQEGATKDGFMKSAFRDMKESAKLQRQIDKANFQAVKLETKAFYEEQKRLSKPSARSTAERARMQRELEAANKRVEEAQAKVNSAKKL